MLVGIKLAKQNPCQGHPFDPDALNFFSTLVVHVCEFAVEICIWENLCNNYYMEVTDENMEKEPTAK